MSENTFGVGGGCTGRSWAERLGSSLPPGLDKNILEIVLDKDLRGPYIVSDKDCARIIGKLGIDSRPGGDLEGVQICPNGRGVILLTMKKDIQLDRFCRYETFQVTESGIRSIMVKPAGKKEVIVNLKGVPPNTRDSVVVEYLSKFGKLSTSKVVYGLFADGPLKGIRNGDRAYKVEIKPGMNIGSYHVIEGQKICLRYQGQLQTCGRCHETSRMCKGGGIAKKCQDEGGLKVEFTKYILDLWKTIGYTPSKEHLGLGLDEVEDEIDEEEGIFSTVRAPVVDRDKLAGVTISRFPKGMDDGQIVEFLCRLGLSEEKKDDIVIKTSGIVTVKNLDTEESRFLIDNINGKKFFDRKMYCNGIVPLTPEKQETNKSGQASLVPSTARASSSSDPSITLANLSSTSSAIESSSTVPPAATSPCSTAGYTGASSPSTPTLPLAAPPLSSTTGSTCSASASTPTVGSAAPLLSHPTGSASPCSLTTASLGTPSSQTASPTGPTPDSAPVSGLTAPTSSVPGPMISTAVQKTSVFSSSASETWNTGRSDLFTDFPSNEDIVRRHSVSLSNRTPPSGSIAAQILSSEQTLSLTKLAVKELKCVSDQLSDFNSCVSELSSEGSIESADETSLKTTWTTMNERRRNKRNKRKNSLTPNKEEFLKKQNRAEY